MNKYFSYDPFEGEVNYHDSEKEAKTEALKLAENYYDDCREWDGSFDETTINQIELICYGLVLGNIDLPTRPVNDDDDESLKEEFSEIVENPVIVELEKSNKWTSVRQQEVPYNCYFLACTNKNNIEILCRTSKYECSSKSNFCYVVDVKDITHWQPLPEPPEEE